MTETAERAVWIGSQIQVVAGNPNPKLISTSLIERQYLKFEWAIAGSRARQTHSRRKIENLEHSIALHYVYYNFVRIHQTSCITPAMQIGVADHVWSLEELVLLVEQKPIAA